MPEGGFKSGKGHYMTFLRQPEQRMLSAWNFLFRPRHDFTVGLNDTSTKLYLSGWRVKKLTRKGEYLGPVDWSWLYPNEATRAEIEEAKIRLETGFSFIGISDQYDLSLSLFNKMYNQRAPLVSFTTHAPDSAAPRPRRAMTPRY
mmetsp:Transcript_115011/g.245640  ORF Transcript_115011/g.245640 Transcript_115011/m.245640 type:complete len:145 (-) Transcript_115011:254-688(-)